MMRKNHQRIKIVVGICCIFLIIPVAGSVIDCQGLIPSPKKSMDKDFPPYSNHTFSKTMAIHSTTLALNPSNPTTSEVKQQASPITPIVDTLLDHPWPMQGYNKEHLGRSPYSTSNNPGIEKWRFRSRDWCDGSPAVANDGTIYFGDSTGFFYAVNPNCSLKWKTEIDDALGKFGSSVAIAPNGTIYLAGKYGSRICALNPNGTVKWKSWSPEVDTSITIDGDGVIYYGHHQGVTAQYPNGTLKWVFHTGDFVQSTPAVDDNRIIYFGSHDHNVYAVYPNGTMKWSFPTGNWVHGSPTVGSDGTIYVGCDSGYLYALYPNGTMKWRVMVGGMRASPSLDKDGNLYFGVWDSRITSVAPNGTIRWTFPLGDGDRVWGSTAAISDDGTVYVGVNKEYDSMHGGEIVALDLNGTLKWRKIISDLECESSPVIGADGTVYICSAYSGSCDVWGHLHAFGQVTSNTPPNAPVITGPETGHVNDYITIYFNATDDDLNPITYYIDWGYGEPYGWTGEWGSGEAIYGVHQWPHRGSYIIKAKARDSFGAESDWGTLRITMPLSYNSMDTPLSSLLQRFFERHPHAFPILQHFLGQ
jgi:outer membrane protein assembly factor BamB